MQPSDDFLLTPEFDYDAWRDTLRQDWGWYNPQALVPKTFTGRARSRSLCGFVAMDLSCNAPRVERTNKDFRLDGMEHYYAVFQVAGASTMIQSDEPVRLAVGDVAFVDAARPVTYVSEERYGQWFSLQLPRRSLVSHLGFEPQSGSAGHRDTRAGRLLFQLVLDAVEDEDAILAPTEPYMRLAIYDLLGAQFAPSDLPFVSSHSDKLFRRVCAIIKDRFADPDLAPSEVAAEAGISLRYLQKLFTARGQTCSRCIYSCRLDQAARLLKRRALTRTGQPLSEIAYACGFRDYTHFARAFRRRFGYPPSGAQGCLSIDGRDG